MSTIVSKIKVRRGPFADFIGGSGVVLDEGEFGLVLDTRDVYIGYGSQYFPAGNIKLITELDGIDKLAPAVANYNMNGNRITNMGRAVDNFDAVTLIDLTQFFQATTRGTTTVTLAANTGSPAACMTDPNPISPAPTSLNAVAGQFSTTRIYYTAIRGTSYQGGVLTIVDNGTTTDITDNSIEIPTIGSVGIDFSVVVSGGVRVLKYQTTAGGTITMRYSIDRWV